MIDLARDPDFLIRWPNHILADELRRLILRGQMSGTTPEWREEVEQLLQQAFVSTVPVEEFRRLRETTSHFDEEPF